MKPYTVQELLHTLSTLAHSRHTIEARHPVVRQDWRDCIYSGQHNSASHIAIDSLRNTPLEFAGLHNRSTYIAPHERRGTCSGFTRQGAGASLLYRNMWRLAKAHPPHTINKNKESHQ